MLVYLNFCRHEGSRPIVISQLIPDIIYLKSALKCDSFDVAIDIKIQFFRVLVTIEPGHSLLQFVTTNCFLTAQAHLTSSFFVLCCNSDLFYP